MYIRKKLTDKGVSPVIATILMVAITVVLAAVLYVMVIGFSGSSSQQPAGTITTKAKATATSEKLTLSAFNPETKWADCKLVVENVSAGTSFNVALSSASGTSTVTCTITGTPGFTITGTDLAQDNKFSGGDYFTIGGLSALSAGSYSYKVSIIYIATGGVVDDMAFDF